MALFAPGMPCRLCGKPMAAAADLSIFAPFVADRSDPLFVFSDAAIHTACFARHALAEEATRWHDEAVRHGNPSERRCTPCGKLILDPDDYFGTGLLARDADNPLYEFNFVHIHQRHVLSWERFDQFRRLIETALASGAWGGPRLVLASTPVESVRWAID